MSQKNTVLLNSLRNETKGKFDSLLKAALFKKNDSNSKFTMSTEHLIENNLEETTTQTKHQIGDNINESQNDDDVKFFKPPVPKPRKSKTIISKVDEKGSTSSKGTYTVASKVSNKLDSGSAKTFIASPKINKSPKITKPSEVHADAEQRKALINNSNHKSEIVGDVVVHNNSLLAKTIETINSTDQSDSDGDVKKIVEKSHSIDQTDFIRSENGSYDDKSVKAEINEAKPKPKTRKGKRKKNVDNDDYKIEETKAEQEVKTFSYDNIVAIIIHKATKLQMSPLIVHPLVKVHIVDGETGEYLKKSTANRPVLFYYENSTYNYIGPIMTHSYNFQEKRSLHPEWEETIVLNEDFNYLVDASHNIIIFFELIDFMSMPVVNSRSSLKINSRGWHKIAWAFLKLVGQNASLNTNKKVRLQLYEPGKYRIKHPTDCDVYEWWRCKKWTKYPSTLYVTVKKIACPGKVVETIRSKTPLEKEKESEILFETNVPDAKTEDSAVVCENVRNIQPIKKTETLWGRLKFQACKLPNKCVAKLHSYDQGSMILKFSNNGLFLASAVLVDEIYVIVVYSMKTFDEVCKLSGHQGMIYSISWNKEDKMLISSSADGTVNIWDFERHAFVQMLPHPSYLYTSEISSTNIIATGCYDSIIRIWTVQPKNNKNVYVLVQELECHDGYVTSLCFNANSTLLFSADSSGVIVEWAFSEDFNCKLKRKIILADLKDVIINQILLHVREKKLIVHARDSTLRIVDLKTEFVVHWLQGAINNSVQTNCTFSPCGTYILAGGENCVVNVWNCDKGKFVAAYFPWGTAFNFTIHCVQFHPYGNIIALSHYGRKMPILVCAYDTNPGEDKVELRIINYDAEIRTSALNSDFVSKARARNGKTEANEENLKIHFKDILQKIDTIILPQTCNKVANIL